MSTNRIFLLLSILAGILLPACEEQETTAPSVALLSASINGGQLSDGLEGVDTEATVVLVFSASLDPGQFESAFAISPASDASFNYAGQGSRVEVQLSLNYNTLYTLQVSESAIGQDGGMLEAPLLFTFRTKEEGGASGNACTSATAPCLRSLETENGATLPFYASFPIQAEEEQAGITSAVLVVHGANRNADDYFEYMISGLSELELEGKVLLLAPQFQEEASASSSELYWSGNGWREGRLSGGPVPLSTFELADWMIDHLADQSRFPNLTKVIVTGHSSGGLFTHLFAASNRSEASYPAISFEYVVANSQYFYYPDGQRIEQGSNQLYIPSGCSGYTIWPMGYEILPTYLSSVSQTVYNDHFANRSITYLLGNGEGPDGSLNTTDCSAVLLGPTRYERGENMFRYMDLVYGDEHQHKRTIVPGVGHDGAGMYRSDTFKALLVSLLE